MCICSHLLGFAVFFVNDSLPCPPSQGGLPPVFFPGLAGTQPKPAWSAGSLGRYSVHAPTLRLQLGGGHPYPLGDPPQQSCHVSYRAASVVSSTAPSSFSISGYSTSRRVCFSLLYPCAEVKISNVLTKKTPKQSTTYVTAAFSWSHENIRGLHVNN